MGKALNFDVLPVLTPASRLDGRKRHAIFGGKFTLGHSFICPNISNGLFGKKCVWAILSFILIYVPSPLGVHILRIIRCRSAEKVVRVCANWIIAVMANPHSRWNLPDAFLKRKSVRQVSIFSTATERKHTIPGLISDAGPSPAALHISYYVRFVNTCRRAVRFTFVSLKGLPTTNTRLMPNWIYGRHLAGFPSCVIMWSCTIALLLVSTGSTVFAQSQAVQQSGVISPNHVPVWITNGVVGDGGVSTSGNINTLGITSTSSLPFCIEDTQIHTGPYRQFCFGLTSSGATIYLTPYGGEVNQALNFVINGVTIPFPQPIPPPPIAATPLRTVTSGSTDTATVLDANGTVAWNSSSALAKTETLPTCNFAANGFTVAIKDEIGTAGTYPIAVTGVQTLDGQAVYIMAFNYQATAFQCDSTESNWVVK